MQKQRFYASTHFDGARRRRNVSTDPHVFALPYYTKVFANLTNVSTFYISQPAGESNKKLLSKIEKSSFKVREIV